MIIGMHTLHVPGADPARDEIVRIQQEKMPGLSVHEDPERRGVMPTWLEALSAAALHTRADWTLIVQDDALPLDGWAEHLEEALWFAPQPVVGLTHFGSYGAKALKRGAPYAVGKYLMWGGAIAYRQDFLRYLNVWAHRVYEQTGYPHDDCLVAVFAKKQGYETSITSRALFDQPVQQSLMGHNTLIRRPSTTIVNTPGPRYSVVPRAARVSRAGWDSKMDDLGRIN